MPHTDFENIERYISRELSQEEREKFESRLEEDTAFRQQYMTYKEVNQVLSEAVNRSLSEQKLRENLQHKRKQYFEVKSKVQDIKKHRKKRWMSVVSFSAAAAIIILLVWSPWKQSVLNNYGQIQMTNPTVRGEEQLQGMTKASELFNEEKFKEVLPLLDSAVQANPGNAQNLFYRGVTLLHLKKNAKAKQDLKTVFNGESIYRYEAAYFIALSYLQDGVEDSGRIWLHKIPHDAAISPKAKKILKKIAE